MKNMNVRGWMGILVTLVVAVGISACDDDPDDAPAAASAGSDQRVLIGDSVTVDGSASTGVEKILWSIESKPDGSSAALTTEEEISSGFTADVAGTYVLKLSLNDGASTDTVQVTAKVVLAVITNGSGSSIATRTRFGASELAVDLDDAGGILSGESSRGNVVNYTWEQVSGPFGTATGGSTSETLAFTAPGFASFPTIGLVGAEENADRGGQSDEFKWQILPVSVEDTKMYFKLTVDDGEGNSDTTTEVVYVQDAGTEIRTSSGLPNVGVGSLVILQGAPKHVMTEWTSTTALCSASGGPSAKSPATYNVKSINGDWTWTLTPPSGSTTVFEDSGTTTSTGVQFPKFTPDVEGLYTVAYTATVDETSTTPDPVTLVQGCGRVAPSCTYADGIDRCTIAGSFRINAASYTGIGTIGGASASRPECGACHNGSVEEDFVTSWQETKHAKFYENAYTSLDSLAPEPYVWAFGTVGYDPTATSGGFDDLVASTGFDVAAQPDTYAEFTSSQAALANMSGVQCENCHGPGSRHNGDATAIAASAAQYGVCGQCHQEEAQWINSFHNSTGVSHGSGRYQASWLTGSAHCTRCHTSKGLINYIEEGEEGLVPVRETGAFVGVQCAGCHNPHDATNPAQLRLYGAVTMEMDDSEVDAGRAAVCYNCHQGLYNKGEVACDYNRDGVSNSSDDGEGIVDGKCETLEQTADFYWRQQHYNPQAPVLEGKGALTDLDKNGVAEIFLSDSSFHGEEGFILAAVSGDPTLREENDKCVTCHMAEPPDATEEGFRHLGGHTFKVREGHGIGHLAGAEEDELTGGETGEVENIIACTPCHTDLTALNREARADYDGDLTIEGVQDEVKGLALLVSNAIKDFDKVDLGTCTAVGNTKCSEDTSVSCTTDANCIIRKVTDASGTKYYGPCVTATSICTSTLTGGHEISCSADADCIVADALAYTSSATGYNAAGSDARPCNVSNKCTKDTTLSCAGGNDALCNNLGGNTARGNKIRRGAWNHNLIVRDASFGIHNTGYAVQVLQGTYKSIAGKDVPNATLR